MLLFTGFVGFLHAQSVLVVKVLDEEKLNMPGAVVKLTPGDVYKISNQNGVATFQQLKAGNYTISILYLG